jgi:hypothetical protein
MGFVPQSILSRYDFDLEDMKADKNSSSEARLTLACLSIKLISDDLASIEINPVISFALILISFDGYSIIESFLENEGKSPQNS